MKPLVLLLLAAATADDDVLLRQLTASLGAPATPQALADVFIDDRFDYLREGADYAFAAVLDDGRVIAWGDAQYGGDIHPWTAAELHDVADLYHTTGAFAAHRRDKSVVAWGDARYGGDAGRVVPGVAKVYANDVAFAALETMNGAEQRSGVPGRVGGLSG